MLDGVLARIKGTSGTLGRVPRLDHGPDRGRGIFSGLVDLVHARRAQPAAGRGVAVLPGRGHLVSYVKARAEGLGLRCDVGLIERPERMLISPDRGRRCPASACRTFCTIGLWALAAGSAFTLGAADARGPPRRAGSRAEPPAAPATTAERLPPCQVRRAVRLSERLTGRRVPAGLDG